MANIDVPAILPTVFNTLTPLVDKYNNTNTEQDYIKNTKEYLKNIIEMQKNNNNN
jgi:hypothetical protein